MVKINAIDFFCGCGGTSAGLQKCGINILAGIDFDKNAIATYKTNFPNSEAINIDIKKLSILKIKQLLTPHKNDIIVFAACAPCQPFSKQNQNKTNKDDDRISLLDEFHRFVKYFLPDYILLENVPGMQKILNGPFTKFINLLDMLGYQYDTAVKNAMNYGVPQSRKRLVLIASRHGFIKLPNETHGINKLSYKTVRDCIAKYPPIKAGEEHPFIPNHRAANLSPKLLERINVLKEGEDRRKWSPDLELKCHKKHTGHTDVYGRLTWDKPSVTLTTKCTSLSNGRFGHPVQNRALSVREAAAIQTFDDNFIFCGSLVSMAKQVGNAVPVDFACALGQQIVYNVKNVFSSL